MDLFSLAIETVEPALVVGRIGTPVALRVFAQTAGDASHLISILARSLETASRWLAAEPASIYSVGTVGDAAGSNPGNEAATPHVALAVRFANGLAAVLSAGLAQATPRIELVVIGNRGVISWEPDYGATVEVASPRPVDEPAATYVRLVEEALAAYRPLPETATTSNVTSSPAIRLAPPYGVLLVAGSHTHQENYAEAFAADPRCRLIAVTDEPGVSSRRRALNERLARQLGIPYLDDLAAALRRDDVQIVSICVEPERRSPIAVAAAQAGKHPYLDKPLAASSAQADAIVAAVQEAGVASQMFSLIGSAAAMKARTLARSQALGPLAALHADLLFAKGDTGTANLAAPRRETAEPHNFEWVESKREFSNVGVYPLALAQVIWQSTPQRIWAVTGNYFFAEHQANQMEDFGLAVVEYGAGRFSTIVAGRTGWRSHPASGINRTYLVGTRSSAVVDAFRPRAEIYADVPPWTPPRRHPEDPMGFWSSTIDEAGGRPKYTWQLPPDRNPNDIRAFVDCLETGRPSDLPATAAAWVQKALMSAYRSAASGEAVPIE